MENTTNPTPAPKSGAGKALSIISLILSIIMLIWAIFWMIGTTAAAGASGHAWSPVLVLVLIFAALAMGVIGFMQRKKVGGGKGVAIAAIVISVLCFGPVIMGAMGASAAKAERKRQGLEDVDLDKLQKDLNEAFKDFGKDLDSAAGSPAVDDSLTTE